MQPILIPNEATLNYVIKPSIELNGNPMVGTVGTRRIATFLGVKSGDPLSAYTMPEYVLQPTPTTAEIDANSVTPFGNPTPSKQTWALQQQWVYSRLHSQILTTDIGLPNYGSTPLPPTADVIVNNLVAQYGPVIVKDFLGTSFWSHPTFDPDTTYTGTHKFPEPTIDNYKNNTGFMKQLTTALAASAFSNYKTSNGTDPALGIDVDGATLSSANAKILMDKMIAQAPMKLQYLNSGMPSEYRPYFMLSKDFFESLKSYVASTYSGVGYGYLIFATGKDGRPDMKTVIGFMYDGYEVYNAFDVLDRYWIATNPATKYNHMGIFTARENLSIGLNLKSPTNLMGGNAGLGIFDRANEPEKFGAKDLSIYLAADYLISDTSLFSTVGLELAP